MKKTEANTDKSEKIMDDLKKMYCEANQLSLF